MSTQSEPTDATHARRNAWRRRAPSIIASLLGGVACLLIFRFLAPLTKDQYSYRDDAVITLSHAKNLIDFGAIGIDAAGARVEGFSTPLQFWIFVVVYGLTGCGYQVFLDWQVLICTGLLGCALVQLFRPHLVAGVLLTIAIAAYLATCVRFFGWHHSGMENAYLHVLLVALIAFCQRALVRREVGVGVLLCAWLASLARLESVVHVAPLLVVWSFAYTRAHHSFAAVRGSAFVLVGWGVYQLFRYVYFGSLSPNTAVAEGIDLGALLRELATSAATPSPARDKALLALRQIAGEHRAYLALASIPLLALGARNSRRSTLVWMLGCLALSGLAHPLLFGPARLDPVRTTSHVALVAPLLLATQWNALSGWPTRAATATFVVLLALVYVRLEPKSDQFFCCPIVRADRIAEACLAHAHHEQLVAPSLANPDLGRISFRKSFLLFDLGLLGSPPLAQLRDDPSRRTDYLLELAQPDFIELHGAWACEYSLLMADPRFRSRYVYVPASKKIGLTSGCHNQAGIYFRRALAADSGSPERAFHDALRKRLDLATIAAELSRCQRPGEREACVYVARTV
ncbi:MAG: hypothetical protein ABW321_21800, partial [Polyangiales bacterium]